MTSADAAARIRARPEPPARVNSALQHALAHYHATQLGHLGPDHLAGLVAEVEAVLDGPVPTRNVGTAVDGADISRQTGAAA